MHVFDGFASTFTKEADTKKVTQLFQKTQEKQRYGQVLTVQEITRPEMYK